MDKVLIECYTTEINETKTKLLVADKTKIVALQKN